MSYQFPHFDDIPNIHLLHFHDVDSMVPYSYCETVNDGFHCTGCVFQDPYYNDCMAAGPETIPERQLLINYVKSNHPEYLL